MYLGTTHAFEYPRRRQARQLKTTQHLFVCVQLAYAAAVAAQGQAAAAASCHKQLLATRASSCGYLCVRTYVRIVGQQQKRMFNILN